jgi:hypothetical protein
MLCAGPRLQANEVSRRVAMRTVRRDVVTKQQKQAHEPDRDEFRGSDEIKLRKYFNHKFFVERDAAHMR